MKYMQSMRAMVFGVAVVSASGVMAGAQDTAAQDKMFLMNAAEGGMTEIQASQLALKKSKDADVKAYAQKMIDDHTTLMAQMKPFAEQMQVTPPMKLKPEHQQEMARLKSMSGEKFDKEYVTAMVADHHKDLGDFMTERDTTSNVDLKATVAKGTDVIMDHTQMIDQMAQKDGIPTPPMPAATTPSM